MSFVIFVAYCNYLTVNSIQNHPIWTDLFSEVLFSFHTFQTILSAAVDDDEYPELILPDDSKNDNNNNNDCSNSNNTDKNSCIEPDIEPDNSTGSPHHNHLNKRRRVDSKKSNSDVKSSLKPEKGVPEYIFPSMIFCGEAAKKQV